MKLIIKNILIFLGIGILGLSGVANAQTTYSVGGSMSGLAAGKYAVLLNNGTNPRTVSSNGPFTFSTGLATGSAYRVSVGIQPSGQICTVTSASGTVSAANVDSVSVTCANTYTVGGTVTGLDTSGLVLRLGTSSLLVASGATSFKFSSALQSGATYAVTVGIQPSGYRCVVTSGIGTITSSSISNVSVACQRTYTVSGTISGLTASGLVLSLNGASKIVTSGATSFSFASGLTVGTAYNVAVQAQPAGLICSVLNASGTITSSNITDVSVACVLPTYTVGGAISNLSGNGLTLSLNTGSQTASPASGATSYTFANGINAGSYTVTITSQPTGQTCSLVNDVGTVTSSNISNVNVTCTTNSSSSSSSSSTSSAVTPPPIVLPDTGQTGDFTTTPGEDSDTTQNPPSYTDNGNGTITDNVTGLMWQKSDSGEIDFTNAAAYCTNSTTGGYNNWRMATAQELFGINYLQSKPALHPLFQINNTPLTTTFVGGTGGVSSTTLTVASVSAGAVDIGQTITWAGMPSGVTVTITAGAGTSWTISSAQVINSGTTITATKSYDLATYAAGSYWWSSDVSAAFPTGATTKQWASNSGGGVGNHVRIQTGVSKGTKPTFFNLRCVRNISAPVTLPAVHFTDNGDGTFKDNYTGLVWRKEKSATQYDWEGALAYVNTLNASGGFAGKTDWRLPNIRELFSIVDLTRKGPSLDTTYFTNLSDIASYSTQINNKDQGTFWSSTTLVNTPTSAWDLHEIYNGIVSYSPKTALEYVLVVRGPVSSSGSSSSASSSSSSSAASTYTVGGSGASAVSGLTSGSVQLTLNSTETITVNSGATSFAFTTALSNGAAYSVTKGTDPAGLICLLNNASGNILGANVTNVQVSCQPLTYTVGGTITGLSSTGLVLGVTSSATPSVQSYTATSGTTTWNFAAGYPTGATYSVTIQTQPSGQTCQLFDGATLATGTMPAVSGSVASVNVSTVNITCTTDSSSSSTSSSGSIGSFAPNIVLSGPTNNSIVMNLYSATQAGNVTVSYGIVSGVYTQTTLASALVADAPLTLTLNGLSADTQYFYRVNLLSGSTVVAQTEEYKFRTARPKGSTFTFTIQSDSHLDQLSDPDLFRRTLRNIALDSPDFLIDLGDTFMTEKWATALDTVNTTSPFNPATTEAQVIARYKYELPYYGLATHSVPMLMVNGNHEGEAGYIANKSPTSTNAPPYTLPLWATTARKNYFNNGITSLSTFYSGDTGNDPTFATYYAQNTQRAAYYSWEWGDALFVVLDPYMNSTKIPSEDKTKNGVTTPGTSGWYMTLGKTQYDWLTGVLTNTTAKYKFVFIHNLLGGAPTSGKGAVFPDPNSPGGEMRGGVEAAKYFEWGGYNSDGTTYGFTTNGFNNHVGWPNKPVHQLLVEKGVTAVFHGHDHLYVKQDLDGIVYQEVPQPSQKGTTSTYTNSVKAQGGYVSGIAKDNSGHLRVTVTPSGVTTEYIRSWLPAGSCTAFLSSCEAGTHVNREIEHTWTVTAP